MIFAAEWKEFGSAILHLVVAVIQLIVGLGIATFAIDRGIKVVSKLLSREGKEFNIWEHIKNKNIAVALLGAGVVVRSSRSALPREG